MANWNMRTESKDLSAVSKNNGDARKRYSSHQSLVTFHSFLFFYLLDLISDLAGALEVFAIDAALELLS